MARLVTEASSTRTEKLPELYKDELGKTINSRDVNNSAALAYEVGLAFIAAMKQVKHATTNCAGSGNLYGTGSSSKGE